MHSVIRRCILEHSQNVPGECPIRIEGVLVKDGTKVGSFNLLTSGNSILQSDKSSNLVLFMKALVPFPIKTGLTLDKACGEEQCQGADLNNKRHCDITHHILLTYY